MRFFLVVVGGAVLGVVGGPGAWAAGGGEGQAVAVTVTVVRTVEVAGGGMSLLEGSLSALLGVAALGGLFLGVLALWGIRDFWQFKKEVREDVRGEIGRVVWGEEFQRSLKWRIGGMVDEKLDEAKKSAEYARGVSDLELGADDSDGRYFRREDE